MTVSVLYEDEDVLAVEKPEGIASVPERKGQGDDLITQVMQQERRRLWVIHRLDKAVSGVILFAKHAQAHRYFCQQFQHRRVEKTYLALVHGRLEPEAGTIDLPLYQFGSGRMGVDHQRGKPSRTRYEATKNNARFSAVSVYPITGRRHQIRVHLYHLGHPIVGDPCYGDQESQARYPRLLLHAQRIALTSPSGLSLEVPCKVPASFQALWSQLL